MAAKKRKPALESTGGRPRRTADEGRAWLQIRVSVAEKARYDALAEDAKQSISEIVRHKLDAECKRRGIE